MFVYGNGITGKARNALRILVHSQILSSAINFIHKFFIHSFPINEFSLMDLLIHSMSTNIFEDKDTFSATCYLAGIFKFVYLKHSMRGCLIGTSQIRFFYFHISISKYRRCELNWVTKSTTRCIHS